VNDEEAEQRRVSVRKIRFGSQLASIGETSHCDPLDWARRVSLDFIDARSRLSHAHSGRWRRPEDQFGKPTEVLCDRCQRELELGTAWSAQSQPAEPHNTLQMCKRHLNALPVAA
jgi:hypothetical protein